MGDHGQSFTRTDLVVAEAVELGAAIREWLIQGQVIVEESNDDCVFRGVGHPPASNWGSTSHSYEDADNFLRLRTNGVQIVGGVPGVVIYPNGSKLDSSCPRCNNDVGEPFWAILQDWSEVVGDDERPRLQCPSCGRDLAATDCVLDDSWSLSFVEVTFMNWPPFSESFKAEVLERLGGNSRFVFGKK